MENNERSESRRRYGMTSMESLHGDRISVMIGKVERTHDSKTGEVKGYVLDLEILDVNSDNIKTRKAITIFSTFAPVITMKQGDI